jgi:7-cyano-7-deazaguanine synthase
MTPDPDNDRVLVLFSGGQDSTTCLAWALARYPHVETIGFAYGQRHAVELACREPIRARLATPALGPDHMVDLAATFDALGETALTPRSTAGGQTPGSTARGQAAGMGNQGGGPGPDTSQQAVAPQIAMTAEGLPNTFVPGRNLLFLTCAAAIAYRRGLRRIVAGMCETDYSGYPDCRDDTIKAMQLALNLGMQRRFVLETPLMWRDKAATWELARALGGDALVELIRVETHSCYNGDRSRLHDWGYGCAACPACELRASGWHRWREAAGSASIPRSVPTGETA